jgi:hypothetical protein
MGLKENLKHARDMVARHALGPDSDIAKRLRAVRKAFGGENATRFSTEIGISVQRWNNFERGLPLSKEVAITLVRRFPGLTLDWLYLGKRDGLTVEIATRLDSALSSLEPNLSARRGA